jgi:transposase
MPGRMGSNWTPSPELLHARMAAWEAGCRDGLTLHEIAERIGITSKYLSESVRYSRLRGIPGATARPARKRWTRQSNGQTWQERYRPHERTAQRLELWKRYSRNGWTTEEIAKELRIEVKTLRTMVQRARRHGHPDAIRHPDASGHNWAAVSPASR